LAIARILFIVWGLILARPDIRAQTELPPDSTRQLAEIPVYGRRIEQFATGSRLSSLDTNLIQSYNSASMADVLRRQHPIFIKSYGSAMSATPGFRGTSATQTAVLWHGLAIASPTLGQMDLSLVPVNANAQVTIQHGSASANYGTGAVGGTLLLSSPVQWVRGWNASLQQEAGSFGYRYSQVRGVFGTGKLTAETQVFTDQSRNDFPYAEITSRGNEFRRQENAAYRRQGFTQNIYLKLNRTDYLALRGWYSYFSRFIQPAIGAAHANAHQTDRNVRLMGEYYKQSALGTTSIKSALFNDYLHYQSDAVTPSQTNVDTYQAQIEQEILVKKTVFTTIGAQYQHFNARVDGYGRNIRENRTSLYLLTRYDPFRWLELSLNIRQAFIPGFNPPLTPSLGTQLHLWQRAGNQLSWKATASRSYRVPTLNERYWQPGGNPDIRPEKGHTLETGLVYNKQVAAVQFRNELTLYRTLVDDWIQWQPQTARYWAPVNLLQVLARGAELSSRVQYTSNQSVFTLQANYAYTQSILRRSTDAREPNIGNQLMYVPLHNTSMTAGWEYKQWSLLASLSYTGYRFTSNSNRNWLDSYFLADAVAGRDIRIQRHSVQTYARVNNLFNVSYQPMEGRLMPGRNYSVSIQFNLNQFPSTQ
jgi:vitamin B12 transporter